MLTKEQENALDVVAQSFGWHTMTTNEIRLMMWCAFHYYVRRLRQ